MFSPDPNPIQQRPVIQPPQPANIQKRREDFLRVVGNVMLQRGMPWPPGISGMPTPWDPNTSPYKSIEPGSEVGTFKLAGRDVDLFNLWNQIVNHGGSGKVCIRRAQALRELIVLSLVVSKDGDPSSLPSDFQSMARTACTSAGYCANTTTCSCCRLRSFTSNNRQRRCSSVKRPKGCNNNSSSSSSSSSNNSNNNKPR